MIQTETTALVAHGNESRRIQLREALHAIGWVVIEAVDGPSTIRAFRDQSPQLALIDVDMPDGGGATVCRTLRLLPGGQSTALVVITEPGREDLIGGLLESGADDVLEFPTHPALFAHRLERALRDPARSQARSTVHSDDPTAELVAQLAQDVDSMGDSNVAILALGVSLVARPGGSEPGLRAHETLRGLVPSRIQRALSAFESSGQGHLPRGSTRVYPQGDGRFVVVLPMLARVQAAAKLASALQEELGTSYAIGDEEYVGVANIGIASSPADGHDAADLLRRAETACYCSRQEGGSNAQFYTESMSRWAFERLTLERSLREAVERGEMEVYYQPRVAIADRSVVGFEALVRWNHPQLGLVGPGQFIPLAEETGLIVPLGEWVLRTACQQARAWQDQGYVPVRVSVNLSAAQFRQERLEAVVGAILDETGLAPQWLELEVTESMLMTDAESTVRTLQDLKRMGIHLSIDDFGTGYSSLSYLKRFPIDALKIDRSFVREVTSNPDDAAIATSIILMGHSLHLNVVAEGVEEERQLSFLQVLQCNEAQGFLFSPPVPAARAEAFLRRVAAA